jgi:hypothetical protein
MKNETTTCIGSHRKGEWYAELDFKNGIAEVYPVDLGGMEKYKTCVATVNLGVVVNNGKGEFETLDPLDKANQNLVALVAVPRMVATLRYAYNRLKAREEETSNDLAAPGDRIRRWRNDMEILREIGDTLEQAETVPQ